jgi:aminoglycoside phosphotransferase (APT) family kinase protein
MVRLGDDLVVRLPLHESADRMIRHEQRWLERIAARLPVAAPVPVFAGHPSSTWPWAWSIAPWRAGRTLEEFVPATRATTIETLAACFVALHHPAPDDAPHNAVRGVPLLERDPVLRERLELAANGDVGASDQLPASDLALIERAWNAGLAASIHAGPKLWVHGDLHPRNILCADEAEPVITALLDFSDLSAGDPATDLSCAWFLYEQGDRQRLRSLLGDAYSDADWTRGRAWAALLGLVFATHPKGSAQLKQVGHHTLRQLHLDER